jgi:alpha-galactosidase
MNGRNVLVLGIAAAGLLICLAECGNAQKETGLALRPPMGWNSWNKFGCDVNEALVRETADAVVASGMKEAGYRYIVIDDCWQIDRDSSGIIIPDPDRFPSGMKALADYVHSKGLKFGVYSCAGTKTCQGRPGSHGFETQDAQKYAEWGVDYLKYDWCNSEGLDAKESYSRMRQALDAAGRPIVFSLCEWGTNKPWLWAEGIGHLWRTTGDIQDCWDCVRDWGGRGWTGILDLQVGLESYAGPGHWNDPDMLEVGNGGLTDTEAKAHFSFWCLLAAPLMAGNDLRSMTPAVHDILTNPEVIAVDQDPLGIQGSRIRDDGDLEVWSKKLEKNRMAVILFNRGNTESPIKVSWEELGLDPGARYRVRDLWDRKGLGAFANEFSVIVGSHDVKMLVLGR